VPGNGREKFYQQQSSVVSLQSSFVFACWPGKDWVQFESERSELAERLRSKKAIEACSEEITVQRARTVLLTTED
jgi:hypothetical protein